MPQYRLCLGVVAHSVKITESGPADTHEIKQTSIGWCENIALMQFLGPREVVIDILVQKLQSCELLVHMICFKTLSPQLV